MDCPSGRYSTSSTVYDFSIYWNHGIKRKIKEIIRDITYAVNKQRPKKFRLAGKESGNCKVSAKKRETLVTVTWGWKP